MGEEKKDFFCFVGCLLEENGYLCTFIKKDRETMIKIRKSGNDLGINFPTRIANGLSLREGLYVRVQEIGNRIIIEPSKTNVSYSLNEMLSEITDNNIHDCIE